MSEWGTFPKCGAGLGSWLVLGPNGLRWPSNNGRPSTTTWALFPYKYIANIVESTITLFGWWCPISATCYSISRGAQYVVLKK